MTQFSGPIQLGNETFLRNMGRGGVTGVRLAPPPFNNTESKDQYEIGQMRSKLLMEANANQFNNARQQIIDEAIFANREANPRTQAQLEQRTVPRLTIDQINRMDPSEIRDLIDQSGQHLIGDERGSFMKFLDLIDLPRNSIANIMYTDKPDASTWFRGLAAQEVFGAIGGGILGTLAGGPGGTIAGAGWGMALAAATYTGTTVAAGIASRSITAEDRIAIRKKIESQELASAGVPRLWYSEVLEQLGMEPGVKRTLLGLFGDILFDPLSYMTAGGTISKWGKGVGIASRGFVSVESRGVKYLKHASDMMLKEGKIVNGKLVMPRGHQYKILEDLVNNHIVIGNEIRHIGGGMDHLARLDEALKIVNSFDGRMIRGAEGALIRVSRKDIGRARGQIMKALQDNLMHYRSLTPAIEKSKHLIRSQEISLEFFRRFQAKSMFQTHLPFMDWVAPLLWRRIGYRNILTNMPVPFKFGATARQYKALRGLSKFKRVPGATGSKGMEARTAYEAFVNADRAVLKAYKAGLLGKMGAYKTVELVAPIFKREGEAVVEYQNALRKAMGNEKLANKIEWAPRNGNGISDYQTAPQVGFRVKVVDLTADEYKYLKDGILMEDGKRIKWKPDADITSGFDEPSLEVFLKQQSKTRRRDSLAELVELHERNAVHLSAIEKATNKLQSAKVAESELKNTLPALEGAAGELQQVPAEVAEGLAEFQQVITKTEKELKSLLQREELTTREIQSLLSPQSSAILDAVDSVRGNEMAQALDMYIGPGGFGRMFRGWNEKMHTMEASVNAIEHERKLVEQQIGQVTRSNTNEIVRLQANVILGNQKKIDEITKRMEALIPEDYKPRPGATEFVDNIKVMFNVPAKVAKALSYLVDAMATSLAPRFGLTPTEFLSTKINVVKGGTPGRGAFFHSIPASESGDATRLFYLHRGVEAESSAGDAWKLTQQLAKKEGHQTAVKLIGKQLSKVTPVDNSMGISHGTAGHTDSALWIGDTTEEVLGHQIAFTAHHQAGLRGHDTAITFVTGDGSETIVELSRISAGNFPAATRASSVAVGLNQFKKWTGAKASGIDIHIAEKDGKMVAWLFLDKDVPWAEAHGIELKKLFKGAKVNAQKGTKQKLAPSTKATTQAKREERIHEAIRLHYRNAHELSRADGVNSEGLYFLGNIVEQLRLTHHPKIWQRWRVQNLVDVAVRSGVMKKNSSVEEWRHFLMEFEVRDHRTPAERELAFAAGEPDSVLFEDWRSLNNAEKTALIDDGWDLVDELNVIAPPNQEELRASWMLDYLDRIESGFPENQTITVYHGGDEVRGEFRLYTYKKAPPLHAGTLRAARERLPLQPAKYSKRHREGQIPKAVYELEIRATRPFYSEIDGSMIEDLTVNEWLIKHPEKIAEIRDRGYDVIPYVNTVEDKGSISYVILDPAIARRTRVRPEGGKIVKRLGEDRFTRPGEVSIGTWEPYSPIHAPIQPTRGTKARIDHNAMNSWVDANSSDGLYMHLVGSDGYNQHIPEELGAHFHRMHQENKAAKATLWDEIQSEFGGDLAGHSRYGGEKRSRLLGTKVPSEGSGNLAIYEASSFWHAVANINDPRLTRLAIQYSNLETEARNMSLIMDMGSEAMVPSASKHAQSTERHGSRVYGDHSPERSVGNADVLETQVYNLFAVDTRSQGFGSRGALPVSRNASESQLGDMAGHVGQIQVSILHDRNIGGKIMVIDDVSSSVMQGAENALQGFIRSVEAHYGEDIKTVLRLGLGRKEDDALRKTRNAIDNIVRSDGVLTRDVVQALGDLPPELRSAFLINQGIEQTAKGAGRGIWGGQFAPEFHGATKKNWARTAIRQMIGKYAHEHGDIKKVMIGDAKHMVGAMGDGDKFVNRLTRTTQWDALQEFITGTPTRTVDDLAKELKDLNPGLTIKRARKFIISLIEDSRLAEPADSQNIAPLLRSVTEGDGISDGVGLLHGRNNVVEWQIVRTKEAARAAPEAHDSASLSDHLVHNASRGISEADTSRYTAHLKLKLKARKKGAVGPQKRTGKQEVNELIIPTRVDWDVNELTQQIGHTRANEIKLNRWNNTNVLETQTGRWYEKELPRFFKEAVESVGGKLEYGPIGGFAGPIMGNIMGDPYIFMATDRSAALARLDGANFESISGLSTGADAVESRKLVEEMVRDFYNKVDNAKDQLRALGIAENSDEWAKRLNEMSFEEAVTLYKTRKGLKADDAGFTNPSRWRDTSTMEVIDAEADIFAKIVGLTVDVNPTGAQVVRQLKSRDLQRLYDTIGLEAVDEIASRMVQRPYFTMSSDVRRRSAQGRDYFFETRDGTIKASAEFLESGTALIRALDAPDAVSFLHEMGHVILEFMPVGVRARIERQFGVVKGNWTREAHEAFVDAVLENIRTGKAPTPELQEAFETLAAYMKEVYGQAAFREAPIRGRLKQTLDLTFGATIESKRSATEYRKQANKKARIEAKNRGHYNHIEDLASSTVDLNEKVQMARDAARKARAPIDAKLDTMKKSRVNSAAKVAERFDRVFRNVTGVGRRYATSGEAVSRFRYAHGNLPGFKQSLVIRHYDKSVKTIAKRHDMDIEDANVILLAKMIELQEGGKHGLRGFHKSDWIFDPSNPQSLDNVMAKHGGRDAIWKDQQITDLAQEVVDRHRQYGLSESDWAAQGTYNPAFAYIPLRFTKEAQKAAYQQGALGVRRNPSTGRISINEPSGRHRATNRHWYPTEHDPDWVDETGQGWSYVFSQQINDGNLPEAYELARRTFLRQNPEKMLPGDIAEYNQALLAEGKTGGLPGGDIKGESWQFKAHPTSPYELNRPGVRDRFAHLTGNSFAGEIFETDLGLVLGNRAKQHHRIEAVHDFLNYIGPEIKILKDAEIQDYVRNPRAGVGSISEGGEIIINNVSYRRLSKEVRDDATLQALFGTEGKHLWYPEDLAASVEDYLTKITNDQNLSAIAGMFDYIQSIWKGTVLMHPGWTTVNIMGGVIHSIVVGELTPADFFRNFRKAHHIASQYHFGNRLAKTIPHGPGLSFDDTKKYIIAGEELNETQFAEHLVRINALDGSQVAREIFMTHRTAYANPNAQARKVKQGFLKNIATAGPLGAWWFKLNASIDDTFRTLVYMARRDRGDSLEAAQLLMKKAHFDYGDFTNLEQSIGRRVIPFYAWQRNNIALQFKLLFEKPKYHASFQKIKHAIEEETLKEEDKVPTFILPRYQRNQLMIQMSADDGTTKGLRIGTLTPIQELAEIGQALYGAEGLKEMMHYFLMSSSPLIKAPIEIALGIQTFDQRLIGDKELGGLSIGEYLRRQIGWVGSYNQLTQAGKTDGLEGVLYKLAVRGRWQPLDIGKLQMRISMERNKDIQALKRQVNRAVREGDEVLAESIATRIIQEYRIMWHSGMRQRVPKVLHPQFRREDMTVLRREGFVPGQHIPQQPKF